MAGRPAIAKELAAVGRTEGMTLDLAEVALLLAAYERPEVELGPARRHLAEISALARAARQPDLVAAVTVANVVLFERLGYRGDSETYDDLRNADLVQVIERRRGLPVALGILHIHAARAQNIGAYGINAPGHFLTEVAAGGRRVLCDPFHGGRPLDDAALASLFGPDPTVPAELATGAYPPMADRDVLLRLQNNVKIRALAAGDRERAIRALESMVLVAPGAAAAWRELSGLYAEGDRLRAAIMALERAGGEAAALADLRRRLN
jgi:regulator of sirC expression with transglutaminase-like and TPR domain